MKMTNAKKRGIREFLYILPFIIIVAIFAYYPLYGWMYAFFDYRPPLPLSLDSFVGLKWFKSLVENRTKIAQILSIMRNTFAMSGITVGTSWLPLLFAVFLSEIKWKPFRNIIQTVTTLPNFISWVLVYAVAYSMMNSTGLFNGIMMKLGLINEPILFLRSSEHVWLTQWLWLTWKNLGWAAIMYIAAISGIEAEMYEAAKVDGASRMQTILHITIPSLLPTYFVLLLLAISNFLSNGMEQYFVFQNAFNREYIQVLDLYVYNLAMGSGAYSVSTALSILKTVISVALLFGANGLSKWFRGESIV
ncbi:sugar ABC transporter permease [Spirochaetia bacterium]|nr:sugar ABC transporter permease [Spirochaetia bacterium]